MYITLTYCDNYFFLLLISMFKNVIYIIGYIWRKHENVLFVPTPKSEAKNPISSPNCSVVTVSVWIKTSFLMRVCIPQCWQDHSGPRGHVTAAEEMKDVTGTVELAAENNKRDVTIQPCYTTHPTLFRKSRGRADEVGGRKEERR